MTRLPLLAAAILLAATPAFAQLANIKVVTDASPDYSDMESMVRSITSNWQSDAEKMWALFYWDHQARRQTNPIWMHGYELTDPIRQYNDYGFTMCSTISGIKCSTWNYMGYPCRFWEIGLHTVPDVWYDGGFHHYDDSLSVVYTLCDGKTIAAVDQIGQTLACEASGGKAEPGHIAIYHSLNGTSVNGFLQGADTERTLEHLGAGSFRPKNIHYQWFYYSQDRGHRYILNLRDGESYTRYYARQDTNTPGAINMNDKNNKDYKADRAYYVPNQGEKGSGPGRDPEQVNVRYHIRGNGERTWTPPLNDADLPASLYSYSNLKSLNPGLTPLDPAAAGVAMFKVEGANVICSLKIRAVTDIAAGGAVATAVSTDNGLHWKDLPATQDSGLRTQDLKLIDEVNGSYEVLVKVTLNKASLKEIAFNTITEVNGKTQPQLHLGKNTVYVGCGEQTESITLWPDLRAEHYKQFIADEKNVKAAKNRLGQADPAQDSYVTYRIDAPTDLTAVTYGGRLFNSGKNSHIDFLHSFDNGKTWKTDYSLTDHNAPYDVIHYETISDIPTGTRSVLLKYALAGSEPRTDDKDADGWTSPGSCSLYNVHMEANHKLAPSGTGVPPMSPLAVTFTWQERQKDFSLLQRSHTQLVDKLPATYTLNVGGEDHPIVNSLAIRNAPASDLKPGYSDGNENASAEKWTGTWATYGKNLAINKPYTLSIESATNWDAGDPDHKKLTDGRVGSSYTGGVNFREGAIWPANKTPEITVDLGETQKCAAFRIQTCGYEWWDSLKNENQDQIELLTSTDNQNWTSQGFFKMNFARKDVPLNFMLPDDETLCGPNLFLAPKDGPVEARYVRYKITTHRMTDVSEVQVLDSFEFKPFDLKIALPDPAQNGKRPPNPDLSPNAKKFKPEDLPQNIIGVPPKKNP